MTGNGAQTPETRQRHGWLLAGLLAALAVTLFLLEGPLGARVVTIEPAVVLIFDGKAKKVVLAECETLLGQWRETNGTMESASTLGAYLECLEQLHYMGKISWDDYRARLKPVMTAESFAALFEGSNVQSGLKLFNRRLNRILNTRWQKVTVSNPVPAGHNNDRWVYREISKSTHAEYDRVRVVRQNGRWLAAEWASVPRLHWTGGIKGGPSA